MGKIIVLWISQMQEWREKGKGQPNLPSHLWILSATSWLLQIPSPTLTSTPPSPGKHRILASS